MSSQGDLEEQAAPPTAAQTPPHVYMDARTEFASHFLFGEGLEIGPLHQPLTLPAHARARYVDRMSVEDLRSEYPELRDWNLTPVDIIDDGEVLGTISEESQNFIVANHFLEHTENPINTIRTHLGKLKPGGVLFYAVPDKRYTFDFRRPVTPLEEMVADYERGPEHSRRGHYDDWTRLVIDADSPHAGSGDETAQEKWAEAKARKLEAEQYSIHMHVWTQAEFLDLILECRRRFEEDFDIEAGARQSIEFMVVLRKRGELPEPPPPPPPPMPPSGKEELRNVVRKAAAKVRRELRAKGRRASS